MNSPELIPDGVDTNTGVVVAEVSGFLQHQVNLVMEIESFLTSVKPIQDLDDFVAFKENMNAFIKRIFANKLIGKSEAFVLAFDQSNVSKYPTVEGEDSLGERKNLRNLLQEKNKLYGQMLLKALQMGLMDSILSVDEKNDIENIVMSRMIPFFDNVYINWLESTTDEQMIGEPTPKNPVYGGMQNGKFVGYGAFSNVVVDNKKLEAIQNPHIRSYLLAVHGLLSQGISDYSEWVGAEIHESRIWQDQSSKIGFVSPMEDYVAPEWFVDPELIFFLKDHRNSINYSELYNLSSTYFGDRYGMDRMTCTHVEPILEAGDATYSGFIGKTFPNDLELGNTEGNNVIIVSNLMKVIVSNAEKSMGQLFPGLSIDMEALRLELMKEVTYHEFGHSLFVKGHPTSVLEEAKATLFYFLRIHQEHTQSEYSQEDIERIVHFTIMDSLRTIERMDQSEYYKYTILMKSVLAPLFASGLVEMSGHELQIDPTKQKFDIFLGSLKDFLFEIQRIYTLDTDGIKREEQIILEKLNKDTQSIIEYISQKIQTR